MVYVTIAFETRKQSKPEPSESFQSSKLLHNKPLTKRGIPNFIPCIFTLLSHVSTSLIFRISDGPPRHVDTKKDLCQRCL